MERPRTVLFACTLNAVRSPIAAALLQDFAGADIRVASAGVHAGRADPYMVAVLDEIGIDVCDHEPKTFEELGGESFDLIITLSPEAYDRALELVRAKPTVTVVEYWPTFDASSTIDGLPRDEAVRRYRSVREALFDRIRARFGFAGGRAT